MSDAGPAPRRLGRPPASSGAETRARILDAAQRCFAHTGYDSTTNRSIAAAAGITTGAIYHYFDSKPALYQAAFTQVEDRVFGAFRAAVAQHDGLVPQLQAVLDAAVELNRNDPTLAAFVIAVPTEARHHSELESLVATQAIDALALFGSIVDEGRARGELADGVEPLAVVHMLLAITTGLGRFAVLVADPDAHAAATSAFSALLGGTLFRADPSSRDVGVEPRVNPAGASCSSR